jgi:hypothetical protein
MAAVRELNYHTVYIKYEMCSCLVRCWQMQLWTALIKCSIAYVAGQGVKLKSSVRTVFLNWTAVSATFCNLPVFSYGCKTWSVTLR